MLAGTRAVPKKSLGTGTGDATEWMIENARRFEDAASTSIERYGSALSNATRNTVYAAMRETAGGATQEKGGET